ncbi:glycerophosphodiester phosphodiesterase family protein [Arhodomonas sp. AD133]|uniref:glycerophosphodiester phosphodiesterase family protein n=1 Tax=Arhodomonas sp. AD133 TaxID=3415009 RepID=UPI003EB8348E
MIADRIIAHRGASSLAPENTLAAVELAAALGVRWIEVDMRLIGDGTPVIFHDERLERCTDGHGSVRDMDRSALRSLDAGSWFGPRFPAERVPLLGELLERCRRRGLGLNLELKRSAGEPAEPIVAALAQALAETPLADDRLLVSSFDEPLLAACREASADWRLGLLVQSVPGDVIARAGALAAVSVHCDWQRLTVEAATTVKEAGLDLYCYTANDPRAFQHLWRWGVDGVITDRPQDFLVMRGWEQRSPFAGLA